MEKPRLLCLPNGPYYLLADSTPQTAPYLKNSRGQDCAAVRGVALCRCGGSSNKPFCDGTHGRIGFRDARGTPRAPDARRDYVGRRITIHDNRSICAHAGICTDRLASVFCSGAEPWIDADGAAVEAIVDTIRRCPSGALSYSIDGVEQRDQARPPLVTVTHNGPYAVAGGVELIGVARAQGASTEHYTLCRCGASNNKPFCDGSHWEIGFTDERN